MTIQDVKDRIKLLGLKKSHVADKIGVHQSSLSLYLSGKRKLEVNAESKLRIYLGL